MRIVFMGSAGFACPSLEALLADPDSEVVGIVTQPDRPRGRHLEVSPCAVKERLGERGIPVFTPANVNEAASLEMIRAWRPDLLVVVAYGQILKPALLAIPPLGSINVHGSLLPAYRGAAPIQWAIARGERVTGVTTMYLNERMDAGDIILARPVPIDEEDTGGTLHDKLATVGAEALRETLRLVRRGRALRTPQDEAAATFAPKLKKVDGRVDWTMPAGVIRDRVRAFNPWPACACELPAGAGRLLKVLRVRIEAGRGAIPGEILEAGGEGPLIQAGDGAVRLLDVQPEGKKVMRGDAFLRGCSLKVGERAG
jgi:methionyl-tRNA formyltransferase